MTSQKHRRNAAAGRAHVRRVQQRRNEMLVPRVHGFFELMAWLIAGRKKDA